VAFPRPNDGAIVWHRDRPAEPPVVLAPQRDVRVCAVSPDGAWVATGSHNLGTVNVWEAHSGRLVRQLVREGRTGSFACFSPDGRWLATTTETGCRFWAVATWEPGPAVAEEGHGQGAEGHNFTFSSDSKFLATASDYGIVRLVDVATGADVVRLSVPDRTRLWPQCFTPDGTHLIATGIDLQALYVWDLRTLRTQLARLDLDWDARPFDPVSAQERPALRPLEVQVDLGNGKDKVRPALSGQKP
jgi:WD40 repeat protein